MKDIKFKQVFLDFSYLVPVILITLLVNLFIVGFTIVVGPSMEPTLNSGNVLLVNKMSSRYDFGDIVIVDTSDGKIIKRIIGTPGDTVQITDGSVYINDTEIDDSVEGETTYAGIAEDKITLDKDEYFVLGDNRKISHDSRSADIGVIKSKQVIGKVVGK